MVSECANPGCGAQFLYFGQGQVVAVRRQAKSSSGSHIEFFWLCADCAKEMNLEVTLDGNMHLVPQHSDPALSAA